MEKQLSANTTRVLSHRVGCLEQHDLDAYTVLTYDGPILRLGDVAIDDGVWNHVPRNYIWFAIDMHECGYWGSLKEVDYVNNQRALDNGGSVVSRWTFPGQPEFWVTTDTSNSEIRTHVFVAHDSD